MSSTIQNILDAAVKACVVAKGRLDTHEPVILTKADAWRVRQALVKKARSTSKTPKGSYIYTFPKGEFVLQRDSHILHYYRKVVLKEVSCDVKPAGYAVEKTVK